MKSQKAFVAKMRFFVDDFSKILYIKYGVKPDFKKPDDRQNKQLIKRYLTERFVLTINGKQVPGDKYQIKSYQLQDITLWVTVKIPYRTPVKTIEITNKLMTDLYPDQSNLLIFTYNSVQQAYRFTRKTTSETITL